MAGRLQIATVGNMDKILSENPEFSYFTSVSNKTTNFAKETIVIEPNSPLNFGEISTFTIPQNCGDLLQYVTLKFMLPQLPSIPGGYNSYGIYFNEQIPTDPGFQPVQISYTESIGHAMIEYADLKIGNEIIERITGETLEIYSEISRTQAKQNFIYRTVWKNLHYYPEAAVNTGYNFFVPVQNPSDPRDYFLLGADTPMTVILDLPFYFSQLSELNIPISSIYKQEISFEIKFRKIEDVIVQWIPNNYVDFRAYGKHDTGPTKPRPEIYPYLKNIKLENLDQNLGGVGSGHMTADIIFLDTVEKVRLKSTCRDYLMTETQLNSFRIQEELGKVPEDTFNLSFKNPVRELLIVVQRENIFDESPINTNNVINNGSAKEFIHTGPPYVTLFDYDNSSALNLEQVLPRTSYSPTDADNRNRTETINLNLDNLERFSLTLDGHEIISKDITDSKFSGTVNFSNHHVRTPQKRKIYGYSFALNPDNPQPSGHINFSLFKNKQLYIKLFTSEALIGNLVLPGPAAPNTIANPTWTDWVVFPRNIRVYAKSYNILRVKDGMATKIF